MSSFSWKVGLASLTIVAATAYAVAQMTSEHEGMHGQMGPGGQHQPMMPPQGGMQGSMHDRMMQMMQGGAMQGQPGMHGGMGQHGMMGQSQTGQPTTLGQDAFGTIQEIVQILEADPATDWSKVNIAALREHLIDMNEVTLRAVVSERVLANGIEMSATGEGRTLEAIKRMVPAHARELVKIGWNATTEDLPNGVKLAVMSGDPNQVIKLKALGFVGIMVQGAHHQQHHLMVAKGDFHVN
jgi:hypothetical protein